MSTTLVLQSSAVLAIALAAAFGLRRRSAALRHFVLASSVVIVIAAAVFARITPTVEIAVRPDVYETIFFPVGGASDSNGASMATRSAIPADALTPPALPDLRWAPWSSIVWLAGLVVFTARLLAGLVGLRRVRTRAARVADDRLIQMLGAAKAELRVTRPVRLLFDDAPVGTWGLWRPCIVVPAGAAAWDDERVRAVLAHELAHVQRFDWPVQLAAEALCAAFWFNPLAWLAARRLREEGERACDDVVLGTEEAMQGEAP